MWEETFYLILRVVVYSKNQDTSHWQGLTHRKMEKKISPNRYDQQTFDKTAIGIYLEEGWPFQQMIWCNWTPRGEKKKITTTMTTTTLT